MKRILTLAAALAVTVGFAMPANAQSAIVTYPGANPSSVQANQQPRFTRLSVGTWIRTALGSQLGSGIFAGLSVVPNGGMNVAVQNATTNTPGAIYQLCPDDTNPVPASGTPQLSADATLLVCQGIVTASSGSVGPMTAPGTGLSQYYLLETQLIRTDTNPQTVTFVNTSGVKTTSTLNTWRVDQPNYQLKAGTASSTPAVPTADTGWMGIATVLVPSGTATITSGMISMLPSFAGFIANGANVSVTGLTISSLTAGCLQTNASGVVSAQTCTSGLGSVGATAPITASTVSGTATVGCPTCVTAVNGGTGVTSSGGSTPSVGLSHGDYIDQGSSAQTRTGSLTTGAFTSTGNIAGGSTSGTTFSLGPQMQAQSNGSTATNNSYNVGFKSTNSGTINLYVNGLTNTQTHSFLANGGATFSGPFTAAGFTNSAWSAAGVVTNTASGVLGTSTAPAMSGANITAGTIPNAALVSTPLTGLTAGTGISVGGGTSPSVGLSHGDYCDTTSTQTCSGVKTFSSPPVMSGASITSGTIAQSSVANGYVDLSSTQTVGGAKTFSSAFVSQGSITAGSGTGFFYGEALIANGSDTIYFENSTAGVTAKIDGAGVFHDDNGLASASSTYGPTSATVNGLTSTHGIAFPVYGTGSASQVWMGQDNATTAGTYFNVPTGSTNGWRWIVNNGSSFPMTLDVLGNQVLAGNSTAASYNVSSRREWKKNISTLSPQDALNIALHTPIVRYSYNGKGGHPNESGPYRHTGIIANNASDVITTHDPKGERVGEDIGAMGAVAFAAIQRQQQMLDALAYDNKVLRSRIAGLELHAAVERVVHPGWHRTIAKHPTCPKGSVPKRNKNGRVVGCILTNGSPKR